MFACACACMIEQMLQHDHVRMYAEVRRPVPRCYHTVLLRLDGVCAFSRCNVKNCLFSCCQEEMLGEACFFLASSMYLVALLRSSEKKTSWFTGRTVLTLGVDRAVFAREGGGE